MPETLQTPENEIRPVVPPESAEFLDQELKKAENRGSRNGGITMNDVGSQKASGEVFAKLKHINRKDSEAEVPQLSEDQQREVLNQMLKSTERAIDTAEIDPYDAIENLRKTIPGN